MTKEMRLLERIVIWDATAPRGTFGSQGWKTTRYSAQLAALVERQLVVLDDLRHTVDPTTGKRCWLVWPTAAGRSLYPKFETMYVASGERNGGP